MFLVLAIKLPAWLHGDTFGLSVELAKLAFSLKVLSSNSRIEMDAAFHMLRLCYRGPAQGEEAEAGHQQGCPCALLHLSFHLP